MNKPLAYRLLILVISFFSVEAMGKYRGPNPINPINYSLPQQCYSRKDNARDLETSLRNPNNISECVNQVRRSYAVCMDPAFTPVYQDATDPTAALEKNMAWLSSSSKTYADRRSLCLSESKNVVETCTTVASNLEIARADNDRLRRQALSRTQAGSDSYLEMSKVNEQFGYVDEQLGLQIQTTRETQRITQKAINEKALCYGQHGENQKVYLSDLQQRKGPTQFAQSTKGAVNDQQRGIASKATEPQTSGNILSDHLFPGVPKEELAKALVHEMNQINAVAGSRYAAARLAGKVVDPSHFLSGVGLTTVGMFLSLVGPAGSCSEIYTDPIKAESVGCVVQDFTSSGSAD